MSQKVVLDARKLGDGGIGVYLDTLITGLAHLHHSGELAASVHLLIPEFRHVRKELQSRLERWSQCFECSEERAGKYSLSEYLLLANRHRGLLESASLFHSPHVTLPFFLGLPTVVTMHDALLLSHARSALRARIANILLSSSWHRADSVLTVSDHSKQCLKANLGEKPDARLIVVENALHPAFLRDPSEASEPDVPASQGDSILWVGNEKPHKGLLLFLDALSLLAQSPQRAGTQCKRVVIVSPSLTHEQASRIAALGDAFEISHHTHLDTPALRTCYRLASLVVLSSREEGCGLPAMEALGMKRPLVSTPLPSVEQMCARYPFYSKDFSAEALAESMRFVLSQDSKELGSHLDAAWRHISQYTPLRQARRTVQAYEFTLLRQGQVPALLSAPTVLEPTAARATLKARG